VTEKLVTIHKVLGRLKVVDKGLSDARRRLVGIHLQAEEWPTVRARLLRRPK
jgi:hypothetical protein